MNKEDERDLDALKAFAARGQEFLSRGQEFQAALYDAARCPMRSSVTNVRCILPAGHPCDSPTRFHRFSPPGYGRADDGGSGGTGKQ